MLPQRKLRAFVIFLGLLTIVFMPLLPAQILSGIPSDQPSPSGDEIPRPPTRINITGPAGHGGRGNHYAVLIGIGDYSGAKGLENLYADQDTQKLATVLEQEGWTVWLMNSFAPAEKQPNAANILGAFGISIENGSPNYGAARIPFLGEGARTRDDSILFYYGGHGLQGDTDGVDYIIPHDVQMSPTGEILKSTLINLRFLLTALNKTGAGNVIVFTDTCRTTVRTRSLNTRKAWRTRGLTGAFTEDPGPAPLQYQRHFFLENSAADEQSSYELDQESSGVFTYYLRQAMADAPPSSGCIALAKVAERARSGTVNYVQQTLRAAQTPTILADSNWSESFCLNDISASVTDNSSDALRGLLESSWKNRSDIAGGWRQLTLEQLDNCVLSWQIKSHTESGQNIDDQVSTNQIALSKADSQKVYIFNNHALGQWFVALMDPSQKAVSSGSSGTSIGAPPFQNPFNYNHPIRVGFLRANLPIGTQQDANRAANLIQASIDSCHRQ